MMKRIFGALLVLFLTQGALAQGNKVTVQNGPEGFKLKVDGQEMMINGMNWDYFPIGTNFNYSLWKQSDEFIKTALDSEMALLKNMNVNTVRMYTGIPPKWITYIYEEYGIYTMLNHAFGRYGLTVEGAWIPNTEYSEEKTQEVLLGEVRQLALTYKNTPGLLMYLLGNENNYGLFWAGAETEDFPDDDAEKAFIGEKRGRPMYRLMNDAAKIMKAIDQSHPVAICNGDTLFLDILSEECTDIDIYGTNSYRGVNFTDLYDEVKKKLDVPVVLTEFGADAFNAQTSQEDQQSQAYYLVNNWKDIYSNAAGMGKTGISIGGFTFQFSDGWWKTGQTKELDKHNTEASWANGGYFRDFKDGQNNMNEEWFGICAKGPNNAMGHYELYPRAAYYALKDVHTFSPYGEGANANMLEQHFAGVSRTNSKEKR